MDPIGSKSAQLSKEGPDHGASDGFSSGWILTSTKLVNDVAHNESDLEREMKIK
jgi:hypothetical protein